MGAISNLARETERLPAITREQLAVIQSFDPVLRINDITKPHPALWEFYCQRAARGERVYVWMSEEGRVLATAYEEEQEGRSKARQRNPLKRKGVAIMRDDWTDWLNMGSDTTTINDEWGLHSLGTDLHEKVQKWCIEQVENRAYTHGADYYGRVWEGLVEPEYLCPVCGQPKGQPCDHTKLPDDVVSILRKSTQETA